MAELVYASMARNNVTTPSSAATQLTLSTGVGDPEIGLRMTTAITAECYCDPDDKVGFLFLHQGTSTGAVTVNVTAGQGWQAPGSAKTFTVGSTSTTESTLTFLGPFESAKFIRYDSTVATGDPYLELSLTNPTTNAVQAVRVVAFKFPTVEYDT
jgi:hypothetical protein